MIDLVSTIAAECVASINTGGKLLFVGNGGREPIAGTWLENMSAGF